MGDGAPLREQVENRSNIYYGWIVTAACFIAVLAVFSINFSFGVFFDYILADLGRSRADTSLVFSLQTMSLYFSAAVLGSVVDRYGTRPLLLGGAGLLGAGMLATTQATSLIHLYLSYGVIAGLGMGIVYVIGYTTVPRWFDRRRGVATAIGSSGTGIATLAAPPLAAHLITSVGWQSTYFLFTAGLLGLLVLAALVIADDPTVLGLDVSEEFHGQPPVEQSGTPGWRDQIHEILPIVRSRSFALLFLGWLLVYAPFYIVVVYLVTYTTDIGLAQWVGVWALSVMGGMTIPGRLGFGLIGDRAGRTRLFVILSLVMSLLMFTLPVLHAPLLMIGFAAVYGLLWGGTGALISPLIADLYGTNNINTLYGTAAIGFGIASLLSPYLAGKTFELLGTYVPIFVASGGAGVMGVLLLIGSARLEDEF